MKTITKLLAMLLALMSASVQAQLIVEDPISIAQDAMNQVINLGQYVEMVGNQVNQINTMTQQLEQVTAYTQAFGDPSQITNITGAGDLVSGLRRQTLGKGIAELQQAASGIDSLQNNGGGLYQSIGTIRVDGRDVPRNSDLYRKYGAIENTTANYSQTYTEATQRSQEMRNSLAGTTNALQSASTDAEAQKLQGVIIGQAAQLEALNSQVAGAANSVLVQDVQNRNDAEKQEQAQIEADAAEWGRASTGFDSVLTLSGSMKK